MTDLEQKCDLCHGESGGRYVGVACVPGAPVSIAWCSECLSRDCAPAWIFEHDFIHVAGGDLEALGEWARQRETWADGHYVTFDEFVKRITPEMVASEIAKFNQTMRREEEVECVDCGCDLLVDGVEEQTAPRCDTCEAHFTKGCGKDCPVICDVCKEHHFFNPDPCDNEGRRSE